MKTLRELVIEKKCRKGKADGITKFGSYWNAVEPLLIARYGGDGIRETQCHSRLHIRHYRDGTVRFLVIISYWHQNGAKDPDVVTLELGDHTTVEEVKTLLHSTKYKEEGLILYNENYHQSELSDLLNGLGLAECYPSPDE